MTLRVIPHIRKRSCIAIKFSIHIIFLSLSTITRVVCSAYNAEYSHCAKMFFLGWCWLHQPFARATEDINWKFAPSTHATWSVGYKKPQDIFTDMCPCLDCLLLKLVFSTKRHAQPILCTANFTNPQLAQVEKLQELFTACR